MEHLSQTRCPPLPQNRRIVLPALKPNSAVVGDLLRGARIQPMATGLAHHRSAPALPPPAAADILPMGTLLARHRSARALLPPAAADIQPTAIGAARRSFAPAAECRRHPMPARRLAVVGVAQGWGW